ncbi:MAG: DUF1997 domain-containing protein [Candidatus Sericytochromatia bacterium]|nr:DUF1997 domain-containing protein [Candidatus Sericytochromatia bacterium]
MTPVTLRARVSHDVRLACPAEEAFAFFAGNDALLREFLGEDRVERLPDGAYRVALSPHAALGVSLRPSFDVAFVDHPPDRVVMRSLAARLLEGSAHRPADFDAGFEGEAHFVPEGPGCVVVCRAVMRASFGLPAWLAPVVPVAAFEAVASGLMQAAMLALAGRLGPLLERGIARRRLDAAG